MDDVIKTLTPAMRSALVAIVTETGEGKPNPAVVRGLRKRGLLDEDGPTDAGKLAALAITREDAPTLPPEPEAPAHGIELVSVDEDDEEPETTGEASARWVDLHTRSRAIGADLGGKDGSHYPYTAPDGTVIPLRTLSDVEQRVRLDERSAQFRTIDAPKRKKTRKRGPSKRYLRIEERAGKLGIKLHRKDRGWRVQYPDTRKDRNAYNLASLDKAVAAPQAPEERPETPKPTRKPRKAPARPQKAHKGNAAPVGLAALAALAPSLSDDARAGLVSLARDLVAAGKLDRERAAALEYLRDAIGFAALV